NVALQLAAAMAVLSEPFLPFSSNKLKAILNFDELISQPHWNDIEKATALIPSGHHIGKSQLLFSKIEDKTIEAQLAKLEASKKANEIANKAVEPQKETISFDDFTKLDIRVGTIIAAEKMPKAKKLLVLKVDTGIDVRTVVSGIAESYSAEEVVGKKVTVLVNLAPRALRGVESQGMILMTESPDGKLVFVNPDDEHDVSNGLKIS
ncbi:MAG: methionine--tRNA ligase subunit beta, partial [bacterium]